MKFENKKTLTYLWSSMRMESCVSKMEESELINAWIFMEGKFVP